MNKKNFFEKILCVWEFWKLGGKENIFKENIFIYPTEGLKDTK